MRPPDPSKGEIYYAAEPSDLDLLESFSTHKGWGPWKTRMLEMVKIEAENALRPGDSEHSKGVYMGLCLASTILANMITEADPKKDNIPADPSKAEEVIDGSQTS